MYIYTHVCSMYSTWGWCWPTWPLHRMKIGLLRAINGELLGALEFPAHHWVTCPKAEMYDPIHWCKKTNTVDSTSYESKVEPEAWLKSHLLIAVVDVHKFTENRDTMGHGTASHPPHGYRSQWLEMRFEMCRWAEYSDDLEYVPLGRAWRSQV